MEPTFHIPNAIFKVIAEVHNSEWLAWEPYKTLMHAEPLHRYLRAHQMGTFIPKEHK